MLKEIYEQPVSVERTLNGRLLNRQFILEASNAQVNLEAILKKVCTIHIVACGTSYHAAMVAFYWFEQLGISCHVEFASEYCYRTIVVPEHCLLVTLSQSGETADTLSALRLAKRSCRYMATLAICNVARASLVKESDITIMTHAGIEIGVASTKAFTTQLSVLLMLSVRTSRLKKKLSAEDEARIVELLRAVPEQLQNMLQYREPIRAIAQKIAKHNHCLFLGRGNLYPIAMEGALKLKEISYIHAESYASGELKHGPLALIDAQMPVIVVAANDDVLFAKLKSNIEEIKARQGLLYLFIDQKIVVTPSHDMHVLPMASVHPIVAPIVYALPLQLLAYETAVIRGTDVDQPRNLAKSVTVE